MVRIAQSSQLLSSVKDQPGGFRSVRGAQYGDIEDYHQGDQRSLQCLATHAERRPISWLPFKNIGRAKLGLRHSRRLVEKASRDKRLGEVRGGLSFDEHGFLDPVVSCNQPSDAQLDLRHLRKEIRNTRYGFAVVGDEENPVHCRNPLGVVARLQRKCKQSKPDQGEMLLQRQCEITCLTHYGRPMKEGGHRLNKFRLAH